MGCGSPAFRAELTFLVPAVRALRNSRVIPFVANAAVPGHFWGAWCRVFGRLGWGGGEVVRDVEVADGF